MERQEHTSVMLTMGGSEKGDPNSIESGLGGVEDATRDVVALEENCLSPQPSVARFMRLKQMPMRKSLRRSWNQLPRCQRNLIVFGITAVCITLLFVLPGEQILTDETKQNVGVLPFMNSISSKDKDRQHSLVREGHDTAAGEKSGKIHEQARAVPMNQPNIENVVKVPESQRVADKAKQEAGEELKKLAAKIGVQPSNENNDVAVPAFNINEELKQNEDQGDRPALEKAVLDPTVLPGSNGVGIDEFFYRLETTTNTHKYSFSGPKNARQEAVVAAFKHSWDNYKKYAWGEDNLKPISMRGHNWFGLGLTIVDSLDTMYIMDLQKEFNESRNWVRESLNFDVNREVNLFEVTIRVLGGLLATYHLSGDKMFLRKSIELGNRLLPGFLSPSGIPYSDVNLASRSAHAPKWSPDSSTSEVTTLQLEFRDLSRSTQVPLYEKVVEIVNDKVHALEKYNGLVPIFINAQTGTFRSFATISLGARGDSYYEYLLKQWLQKGRDEKDYLVTDYIRAIDGVLTQLVRRTPKQQHVYIGELINGRDFKPKMDHLTCYLPGTLLLGHKNGMPDSHLHLARELLDTCYTTYISQPTHLAPEISHFAEREHEESDIYVKPNDAHNLLRPEFIESLYYFYALTGNRTYQDMGWTIFQAFEKYTKFPHGYSSIGNVRNELNTAPRDMMESFWLSETLKYFYLLFSDKRDEIDLEKFVLNSEGHPLPIRAKQPVETKND